MIFFESIKDLQTEKAVDEHLRRELSKRSNESVSRRKSGRGSTKKLSEDLDGGGDDYMSGTNREALNSFRILSGLDR